MRKSLLNFVFVKLSNYELLQVRRAENKCAD